jgi:hypothetical protein
MDGELDVDPRTVVRMTTSATWSASRSCASSGWLTANCLRGAPLVDVKPGALALATT